MNCLKLGCEHCIGVSCRFRRDRLGAVLGVNPLEDVLSKYPILRLNNNEW